MIAFVDSSVWFGAADLRDSYNKRSKEILAGISSAVLTDYVLIETWRLMSIRMHWKIAEAFWRGIRAGAANLEKVTAGDLEAAWAIGEAFPDQDFSIVDRTSFAVMERLGITRAATFDDHFAVYRYGKNREKAFEILR